jgi:Inhibitor of Apoptosis domain/U-box domain
VARWASRSDPRVEHLRYSPACPFLNGNYAKYRFETARLASFQNWPLSPEYRAQPDVLARSGFFFAPRSRNSRDRCVCFCCGIALVMWEPGDDPWTEHLKHARRCAFVAGRDTDNVTRPGVSGAEAAAEAHQQQQQQQQAGGSGDGAAAATSVTSRKRTEMEDLVDKMDGLDIDYDKGLPNYFMCPITQDLIRVPVVCEDGHSYERDALIQWLSQHDTSPMTNEKLKLKVLFPNHALRQQLLEYVNRLLEGMYSRCVCVCVFVCFFVLFFASKHTTPC